MNFSILSRSAEETLIHKISFSIIVMNDSLVTASDYILSTDDADPAAAAGGGGVMAPSLLSFGKGFGAGCCTFEPELLVEALEEEGEVSDADEEPELFTFFCSISCFSRRHQQFWWKRPWPTKSKQGNHRESEAW